MLSTWFEIIHMFVAFTFTFMHIIRATHLCVSFACFLLVFIFSVIYSFSFFSPPSYFYYYLFVLSLVMLVQFISSFKSNRITIAKKKKNKINGHEYLCVRFFIYNFCVVCSLSSFCPLTQPFVIAQHELQLKKERQKPTIKMIAL